MNASKVTIDPQKLRFDKMSNAKRTQLRKQNMLDLIKSKPFGTPITLDEFAAVGAFTTPSAHNLLKHMIKEGIISKDKSGNKVCYSVNGTPRITRPAEITHVLPIKTLEAYARDFAWEHHSDSLREFIKHMETIELDIRRKASGGGTN